MQELYDLSINNAKVDTQTIFTTELRLQTIVTEANGKLIKVAPIKPSSLIRLQYSPAVAPYVTEKPSSKLLAEI